ncbi:hypothetical protein CSKR_107835 [Clonorchis sinensis]|uniref:Uncharacterized protein n=1 Tax=Clonorchis sinensis TaxID=79923 RepID=A0A3R7FMG9_CLOSI|nr:hypothetical protein CSKR_107835 [Clonorchis sinensis]
MAQWLEREFADRKLCGSKSTSASRLPLSMLGQPNSISALVLPSGGHAAEHRKGVTDERFRAFSRPLSLHSTDILINPQQTKLNPPESPVYDVLQLNVQHNDCLVPSFRRIDT